MLRSATTLPEPTALRPWLQLGTIQRMRWLRYTLPIANLPESMVGLRILHVSDTHVNRTWMPAWTELHRRIAESPPDLILCTGDLVDPKADHRPSLDLARRFLDGLSARLGVWSILGNHDTEMLPLRIDHPNFRLLCSERVTLRDGDAALELIGVHGVHPFDLRREFLDSLGDKAPGTVRIALAHFPSQVLALRDVGVDLMLAGHTHGGQVCLPGGIPIITHDLLPRRFARHVHRIDNTWLAVTRGAGFSRYPIRVFCPAEVLEITLTRS
jgi:predicted MPP superfamily phosphohydrolase